MPHKKAVPFCAGASQSIAKHSPPLGKRPGTKSVPISSCTLTAQFLNSTGLSGLACFDTFDFCAYMNSTDEGISIYSSYSIIEDSEGGYKAPKYFSLASAKKSGFVETDSVERWTKTFKDSLPNSSFAVVEPDYISGKTKDTAARHLPYKDAEGRIDLANLRHALIMVEHVEPATESMSRKELKKVATKNLMDSANSSLKKTSVRDMSKETANMSIGEIATYLSEIKNLKRRF